MQSAKHSILLLLSTLLNIAVLDNLQSRIDVKDDIFSTIGWAYFLVSVTTFMYNKNLQLLKLNLKQSLTMAIWALSTFGILALFFIFPENIDIRNIIISQAISPYIGLVFSLDYFKEQRRNTDKLKNLSPIIFLLIILFLQFSDKSNENSIYLFLILFLFSLTQLCIRIASRTLKASQIYSVGGFFVFIFSVLLQCSRGNIHSYFRVMENNTLMIATLTFTLFFIQSSFIKGIKKLDPSISTILISSSVPLSILYYSLAKKTFDYPLVFLSISYLLSILYLSLKKKKN